MCLCISTCFPVPFLGPFFFCLFCSSLMYQFLFYLIILFYYPIEAYLFSSERKGVYLDGR